MKPLARKLSLWLPLFLYLGLIFFLSSRNLPQAASLAPDFILHGVEYFLLGVIMVRALNNGFRYSVNPRTASLSLFFCWGCAALDELLQRSVPYRVGSFSDLFSDATGSLLAVLAVLTVQKILTGPVRPENG